MAVWHQLKPESAHVAYLTLGVFTSVFCLLSAYIKETLYIGEAILATIYGLIIGPHCLKWFDPTEWGNSDQIALEISRVVLCLQIFISAAELPKKYMLHHGISVFALLVPVMVSGWLIVALFMWVLIPGFNFADALVVSGTITATDPVLAAAVVKGKFAQTIPERIRYLISSESGCNDGMAFPFIYLGINLVVHAGKTGEIAKNFICITILYVCCFGSLIGVIIGYCARHLLRHSEKRNLIDRESFLGYSICISLICAGLGSTLGVDELLVAFAAGNAFSWDGWHIKQTEDTHLTDVVDSIINLLYFCYLGAIIPWQQFNDSSLGLDVWRLIILALVVVFLRRIPIVLLLKKVVPDIRTWNEAWFTGHFGPIGVGSIFAVMLARSELEGAYTTEQTPTKDLPAVGSPHHQLIVAMWPIVAFLVIASILVYGLSVLGIIFAQLIKKKLNSGVKHDDSFSDNEDASMD